MKHAEPTATVFEIIDPLGATVEAGDLPSAIAGARASGMKTAGATINIYSDATLETLIDALALSGMAQRTLAEAGFTLLRLRPPRGSGA